MRSIALLSAAMAWLLLAVGCGQTSDCGAPGLPLAAHDPRRDTQAACHHNEKAAGFLEAGKLSAAEEELKAAIQADPFYGPAHNNLGTVYFRQKRYYVAAVEYQYAAKLMPHRAEPLSNLGLLMETVGRLDDAARHYEDAYRLQPDHPEVIANLTRAYVRANRKDASTRDLLKEILLRDSRQEWIAWARERLATMGASEAPIVNAEPQPPTTEPATHEP